MAKYLLRCSVNHCGRYTDQQLTAKFNLTIELDEQRQKKGESFIEINQFCEYDDVPGSTVTLFVKSYNVEWTEDNEYCRHHISFMDGTINGCYHVEIETIEAELIIGFPEPILN